MSYFDFKKQHVFKLFNEILIKVYEKL